MLERRRFLGTLLGEGADRFPFFDLEPGEETQDRWRREGLPADRSVAEAFDLEEHHLAEVDLRSRPRFVGPPERLADPVFLAERYDPGDATRYGKDLVEQCRRARAAGRVVCVDAWGGGLLQMVGVGDWCSLEATMVAMVEQPARIEALVEGIADRYCAMLDRVLSDVRADYATFYEPIASTAGPVISPAMFHRFTRTGYEKVVALLERRGVPLRILCSTGGDLSDLLPGLIEAGINGLWLSNTRAPGMEYHAIRRTFGRDLALIGGIDTEFLNGDEESLRRSLESTVPTLVAEGRYLPCLDDRPRPTIPFARYRLYRQVLEEIAGRG